MRCLLLLLALLCGNWAIGQGSAQASTRPTAGEAAFAAEILGHEHVPIATAPAREALFSAHVENLGDNDWNAWWEFHDTHETAGQTTVPAEGGADVTAMHGFPFGGEWIAEVTVVDFAGADVGSASVRFVVVDASIESIEFTSDHGVMKDGSLVDGGGALLPSPEWVPGVRNVAISQTKGTPLSVAVTVTVTPANVPFTLTGSGANPEAQFGLQGTSTGAGQTATGTAAGSLPDSVYSVPITIPWTLEVGGVSSGLSTDSGPHHVYCTYGQPRGDATQSRVYWVVQRCFGQTDPQECVERIFAASAFVEGNAWSPLVWKVPGYGGQCRDIAEFCLEAADMLGLPDTGSALYAYPYRQGDPRWFGDDSHNDKRDIECPPHPEGTTHDDWGFPADGGVKKEWLLYKDLVNPGWMLHEGCFKYVWGGVEKYYAGGLPGADPEHGVVSYPTIASVLDACVHHTSWV